MPPATHAERCYRLGRHARCQARRLHRLLRCAESYVHGSLVTEEARMVSLYDFTRHASEDPVWIRLKADSRWSIARIVAKRADSAGSTCRRLGSSAAGGRGLCPPPPGTPPPPDLPFPTLCYPPARVAGTPGRRLRLGRRRLRQDAASAYGWVAAAAGWTPLRLGRRRLRRRLGRRRRWVVAAAGSTPPLLGHLRLRQDAASAYAWVIAAAGSTPPLLGHLRLRQDAASALVASTWVASAARRCCRVLKPTPRLGRRRLVSVYVLMMSDSNSSDNECVSDSSDDFMVAVIALEFMGPSDRNTHSIPRPIHVMTGIQWIEIQLQNPTECFNMFSMTRSVFLHLHKTLVNNYGLKPSRRMCTKEALGMFLWACGAPQSFRQIKNKFGHSLETVSRKFTEVLESITRMAHDVVRPKDPKFGTVHPRLQEARFWPHFKDCIGAIDGTHVPVTVPAIEQPKYIGRHGYPSQNVMAVCDFDMRFTFVFMTPAYCWTRCSHTRNNFLKEQFPHPPDGKISVGLQIVYERKYYLVDSGYPNRKGFLAPYKGQRYHISEWQHGHQPQGLKEVFNHAPSSLRNVIERGAFSGTCLAIPYPKQAKIIVACMALHNFIRDNAMRDAGFESNNHDTGSNANQYVVLDGNAVADDSDMGALRDAIAAAM
ncbi:hypothetical protein U9M48_014530, partial [Paspalum notatum var. saurae]